MPQQGQRTRSTRRRNARPGRQGKPDPGGRGLDTRSGKGLWTGEPEAVITAQTMRSHRVGTPDARKRACPGWGGLGGNRPQGTAPAFYSIGATRGRLCSCDARLRDITCCSASRILPARASRVTVGCEAAGTKEPHPVGWSRERAPTGRRPAPRWSGARRAWEGQHK